MNVKFLLIACLLLASGDLLAKDVDGKTVPFSGVFSGFLVGFTDDPASIAERCVNPPLGSEAWGIMTYNLWGAATHLGETAVEAVHCEYQLLDGTPTGEYGEGVLTLIADNGDELHGTYTNGVSSGGPPILEFMDAFTFVSGGTGRFTLASGGGLEGGTFSFIDYSMTFQMNGVISYSKK